MSSYQCIDCSYSGQTFKAGACPACGSHNIRRTGAVDDSAKKPKKSRLRLVFAVGLWLVLAVLVYQKLG